MAIVVLDIKDIILLAHRDPIVLASDSRVTDKEGSEKNGGHDCYDDCPGGWRRKFFPGWEASLKPLRLSRSSQTVSIFLAITAVLMIFSSSFFPAAL